MTTAAPAEEIEALSRAIVRDAIAAPALAGHLRQVKALTGDTAREYAGRFLIELIQNGYDAQQKSRSDGRLGIRLDQSDGPFGSVYVANTGRAFEMSDVIAISELAQSTKQPGEGIGHKGLGFKSVLQACRWPEVYSSRAVDNPDFDGYCFRFATPEDILLLAAPETGPDVDRVLSDLSPYVLPIPVQSPPAQVRRYGNDGYATVVRLPLDSADALQTATEQIESLRAETVPVQLFLDRISEIVIEVGGGDTVPTATTLTRNATPLSRNVGVDMDVVDLGVQGRYFVATGVVAEDRLFDAIRESVAHNRTDESWLGWQGEACVSIAVPLGDPEPGRLYTYLPMGNDVVAPLAGHVNAPFVTRVARDHLDPTIALNRTLLDVAGEVAAAAACRLPSIAEPWTRTVGVDLLSWSPASIGRLTAGFQALGTTLDQASIVPAVRDRSKATWTNARETRYWAGDGFTVLTQERLRSASGLAFLDAALAPERVDALSSVLEAAGASLDPSPSELAAWVERIAETAARRPFARRWWEGFYEDLSRAFVGEGEVLHGRRILIDADNRLRPGGPPSEGRRRTAAVFFSPRNLLVDEADETVDDDVDVNVPASLKTQVAFMHPDLRWQTMDPTANRQVRRASHRFLEDSRLVTRFRRGTVLQHLVDVLRSSRDKRLHGDALRFVFNLQKGKLPQRPALHEMGFRVPTTRGGLAPAEEALFSAAWPGTHGAELEALIADAAEVSESLAAMGERFIASPALWPFDASATAQWREFLRAVGVRDGLWPVPVGPQILRANGEELRASRLSKRFAIPERSAELWHAAVARSERRPRHPYTNYEMMGRVWLLPGQEDYGRLTAGTRMTYARAVVHGLASWPEEVLETRFRRPRAEREADPFAWPSPVAAFLARTDWLPTSRPGHAGTVDYRRPVDAWHYAESDRDPLPQFAPLVATPFRRLLDQLPLAEVRLRAIGMRLWSEAADAVERLRWMGTLFTDVATTLTGNFRKAYERTWELLSSGPLDQISGDLDALRIVVSRRAQLETIDLPSDTNLVIYIPDHEDRLSDLLFRSVDARVLQVDPARGELAMKMLEPVAGEAILRLTSSADLLVTVDGAAITVGEAAGTRLSAEHPWLSDVVALTLELRATQFNRQSEQTVARALAQLARLRVITGREVRLQLEGHEKPPPPFFSRAVPIQHPDHPTIAIESENEGLGWDELIRLTPAIAEILGEQLMASPLENALVALRGQGGPEPYEPTSRELAVAFREAEERINEIRRTRRGSVEHLLGLIRPVVAYFGGLDATHILDAEDEMLTVADVSAALDPVAGSLPLPLTELLNALNEAGDLWRVRRRLDLPFGEFNRILKALGYKPLTDQAAHAAAMLTFVQANREAIVGCLRLAYLPSFDERSSVAPYMEARRDLAAIQPRPEWLELFDVPPVDELRAAVDEWLQQHGAVGLASWTGQLEPVDELRRDNRQLLQGAVGRLHSLVLAWSARQGVSPPQWAEAGPSALLDVLDGAGLLDFRRITTDDAPGLLASIGAWPEGMAVSADLSAHSFDESDLAAQASAAERDQWRRQQERMAIRLDGVLMPATEDNLGAIAEEVLRTAAVAVSQSDKGETDLVTIKQPKRSKAKGGRGGPGVGPRERLTDAQRTAIGLAGEVVAFEWLRQNYGATPDAWVSTNRRFLHHDNTGDDGLGYDFRLPVRGAVHYFEVKATPGDRGEIELSEGELEVAREHSRKDRYHILFVPHALDSDARRVYMLPNPLHVDARDRYAWVGTGMRYRFALPADE